ncbi:ferrous iron transport protein B [Sporohalobacter salinus]|uniref:ferrous iron transport protein B n=1 Tax=Sporohalobacter salinus TaxID=1494606 RepID=UPI0019611DD8|nr:ferrous iron transport protein B [Sporohalobacter salinus]MBM7622724.1 ferrous iron transport protein B [Sporohalobacter salinus]
MEADRIVLAGNPNVGKSIFFNELTGIYVDVSNFPGTTLDISYGYYQERLVIDTPGVYGVSSFNDEEIVAQNIIIEADIVLNVVDATHLERDLFLTQQIIDMGIPVVVALNMMDEAKLQGLKIDIEGLEAELGVPVIGTVATKGQGLDKVKTALFNARIGRSNSKLQHKLEKINNRVKNQAEALLILEDDPSLAKKYGINFSAEGKNREEIYRQRRQRIDKIVNRVILRRDRHNSFKSKLSKLMVKPLTGIPILFLVLFIIYQVIGVFIAQKVVDFTEGVVFGGIYEPFIYNVVTEFIPANSLLGSILIGEFGLLTMTVTYIFGLLLPLVIGVYFFLSLLEDSGYLPRIAALVDRILTKVGLNGQAVIPLILGFGCVTMAIITTRLLDSKRERVITIFLLGLAIPCSAQLGVSAGLISSLGFKYLISYSIIIFCVLVVVGMMLDKMLPGDAAGLLIDLPPLRVPHLSNVITKTLSKAQLFIEEAGPIFIFASIIITLMKVNGWLVVIEDAVAPIIVNWLKLPKETTVAFIMGVVRRDFGVAGLTDIPLSPPQTLVALVTATLFVPCIASMMIIFKEQNWKEAILIWISSWLIAFGVGGVIAQILI